MTTIFLCTPGPDTCWWCDDSLDQVKAAFGRPFTNPNGGRFCSLDCALDHAEQVHDGPCTVCGHAKDAHPDHPAIGYRHPYLPFGTPADVVHAACVAGYAGAAS